MNPSDLKLHVFELVSRSQKKVKPGDLARTFARSLGVNKREVKKAITELVDEGRLIYTYSGHSWLELPPEEEE
jgi:hypothetical protein